MLQFFLFYFYFLEVLQLPLSLAQRRHEKGESLRSKSIDEKRSYKKKIIKRGIVTKCFSFFKCGYDKSMTRNFF